MSNPKALTFQELILRLQSFWAERGCVLEQPFDIEVGAGTMAPETFLRVLGPKPYKVAYVQPSRRPADGRYGDNPNRLYKHMQLQVILKPPPENVQELYLESLAAIGIDLSKHDIKFEEDNWEAPTLAAWGVGWQVMLDGLEITQFTYFQQCGGIDLDPICAELTYGLERIAAFLQDVDSIYDIVWARDPSPQSGKSGQPGGPDPSPQSGKSGQPGGPDPSPQSGKSGQPGGPDPETGRQVTYGDVRYQDELQMSVYNF